jgi:hypothetical protein
MKITKKIITLLLVLLTALLLISFFLPMIGRGNSYKLADQDVNAYSIYEINLFDFNIFFIILPILATVFLLLKNKNAEIISIGLYVSSFFCNLMYFLKINTYMSSLPVSYTYSSGSLILIISSALILGMTIALIIVNLIEKLTKSKAVEINADKLKESIENLNLLKEQNFITSDEFEEKRACLVKQLKV